MARRAVIALSAAGCLLLAAWSASAQQLRLEALPDQADRPRSTERDRSLERPPVPYEPRFIAPLSKETPNGRAGVAGWTAPNTGVGSLATADPNNNGWLGFGFAVEWGSREIRPRAN